MISLYIKLRKVEVDYIIWTIQNHPQRIVCDWHMSGISEP